jgi:hypothetical protein
MKKTISCLALYASTQFKKGSDVVLSLCSEEYVGPEEPAMPKRPTANDKRVWEYNKGDLVKNEHVLKSNLRIIFTVLYGPLLHQRKNQITTLLNFKEMDKKPDSMALMKAIKKCIHRWQQQLTCQAQQGNGSHQLHVAIPRNISRYKRVL